MHTTGSWDTGPAGFGYIGWESPHGSVTIWHDTGEVDLETGRAVRSGTMRELIASVRLVSQCMDEYRHRFPGAELSFAPDARDGYATARRRVFARWFPSVRVVADYTGDAT